MGSVGNVVDGVLRPQFRLLGPVEVWAGEGSLDAGQPRQRAVLAVLLADAGRPVSVDTLIARVWGTESPDRPRAALQVYLSRIRRLLEQARRCGATAAVLSRVPGGYLLQVEPDQIDLQLFRRLAGTGSPVESLRAALALWRGQPLIGIDGDWASRTRQLWGRERVDAAIAWARAELAEANPGPVLADLAELASENPLVEPLTEVLMLALHAAGRANEALDLYARTRARLADELGTDPGPELQSLHQSLLRGEIAAVPSVGPARAIPRQLPAPPQLFTGRVLELAELDKIHDASTVVITAIDGMAGVGKTALAVQAAHQMVERYPDGQLFIDLHGYTEGVAPVAPDAALDSLLRSLGVAGERIPADLDQRAALYRSRLADQRLVIVLDNAATEAQVRPLLPGVPGCLVLVTSRRRLAGLDHTHTLSLDTLPRPDAIALLRQTAGESRLAGQPPAVVEELVELCGRLPLAIRIAAARLRSHQSWDLAHLVERLGDQQDRLAELQAGERSVTAALDLSYQELDDDQRQTYRRLGLHFGPEIDAYAAAPLLHASSLQAARLLEQLLDAHLLQEPVPGRFRFHDLVRAHAAHTAARDETQPDGCVDRLLDYYRHTAAIATDIAYPDGREYRSPIPPTFSSGPRLPDPTAALEWLDTELPNLLAAVSYADEHGKPAQLLPLSTILHWHLRTRGAYHAAETLHQRALTTARTIGATAAEAEARVGLGHILRLQGRYVLAAEHYQLALHLAHPLTEVQALVGLGTVHRLQGRYDQAAELYQQALEFSVATDNHSGEMETLSGLAHVHRMRGQFGPATDSFRQALRLARTAGDRTAEVQALNGLGTVLRAQGRTEQAADHHQQALWLARAIGHRSAELNALTGLGHFRRTLGQHEQASDHFGEALELARATGHRDGELRALAGIGHVHRLQGRFGPAADILDRLLDLAHRCGNRNWQLEAWQSLGRLQQATGHPEAALTHHRRALELATELDQPDDQARAHDGIAHAHHALHQPEQARRHWRHALDILIRLGVDGTQDEEATAAAIRAHLRHQRGG
jgi:tetratricopeptide (TPR) repeat protein